MASMTAAPAPPRARVGWARLRPWAGPAAVTVLAAGARLWALDRPAELVFDETYYVKDAWTLLHLGYEAAWPEGADPAWAAGEPGGYLADPSFVAHPPLGKWIIALGLAALGAESPWGWRIGIALTGVLLVVLTMAVAHLLFRSPVLTTIAGGLMAVDGNAIVLSRVAVLDSAVALFALLGAALVLLDRRWARARLAARPPRGGASGVAADWGPTLWWRPWLVAAAVAFGLAASVKWNGLYFLAVFGVYSVVSDALLRRQAGVPFWASGTLLRQAPVNFVLLVPLALVVYVASWAGWFATDGGYYRRWIEGGGEAWSGALAWVPTAFQNWWHYQAAMYGYHIAENTPHGYQANPLGWLLLLRPTSMHYVDFGDGTAAEILDLGNPLIWWAGAAALVALCVRVVVGLVRRRRVATEAFILTGIAAGYLPWLLYLHRTVFQFYTIAFEAFLVLALTLAIGVLLGGGATGDPDARVLGRVVVGVFLGLCLLVSAFFWPVWTGQPIPLWFLRAHFWFPSWI